MQLLAAVSLGVLFLLGALVSAVLGVVFFVIALLRPGRPVHFEGVVMQAELRPLDAELGPRLAGPALVRLSGAFASQQTEGQDVLGVLLRLRRAEHAPSLDPRIGDQDLLLGSFESFRTAARDRAATNTRDYLANRYSSVTPWWVSGHGALLLRLAPVAAARVTERRESASVVSIPDAGVSRLARLETAVQHGQACLILSVDRAGVTTEIAELHFLATTTVDAGRLRASMFRNGRGIRPMGFRNGLRSVLYPMSQFGRSLRAR